MFCTQLSEISLCVNVTRLMFEPEGTEFGRGGGGGGGTTGVKIVYLSLYSYLMVL